MFSTIILNDNTNNSARKNIDNHKPNTCFKNNNNDSARETITMEYATIHTLHRSNNAKMFCLLSAPKCSNENHDK